jgi:hypothetical protein
MEMSLFALWVVTPCGIVYSYQRFEGTYRTLKMEAKRSSETAHRPDGGGSKHL